MISHAKPGARQIVIQPTTEFDLATGQCVLHAVDAVSDVTPSTVTISLRHVRKIRWDALCAFVRALEARRDAGIDVRLIDAQPRIERLIRVAAF